jgi:hypothetical protein
VRGDTPLDDVEDTSVVQREDQRVV